MKNLENMQLIEIISKMNICLTTTTFYDIWKKYKDEGEEEFKIITEDNPEGKTALELISDLDYVDELLKNKFALSRFLIEHEKELDKPLFVMTMLMNYQKKLESEQFEGNKQEFENAIKEGKKLLKDVNRTFIYYEWDTDSKKISELKIIDAKEIAEGKNRRKRKINVDRLQALEEDENFGNIIQSIHTKDVKHILTYDELVGTELRLMIEYNTLIDENAGNIEQVTSLLKSAEFDEVVSKTDHSKFVSEMTKQLRTYIEEIDIDRLLLCSAIRFLEGLENGNIKPQYTGEVYKRLQVIKKHLKNNANLILKVEGQEPTSYGTKDLERHISRFITLENELIYLPTEKCQDIINKIVDGEFSLNDLNLEIFKALDLNREQVNKLAEMYPNNYTFLLRHNKCNVPKETILSNIREKRQCSAELLETLCLTRDLTPEEIKSLYDEEIVKVSDLKGLDNLIGPIITNKDLIEKYKQYKQSKEEEKENSKIQLERYALAYRNTELYENSVEELQSKADEFIAELGEDIEIEDLIPLYRLDIIPLKTAVDWGGEDIIEQLLENESLKPADAVALRNEGLLNEDILERLFKKCKQMSYSYQVSLVYAVFDGQTPEEQEIKERLAQYYHIENAITNYSKSGLGSKRQYTGAEEEPKNKVKMRDPGAKYNLLSSFDKGVKIEEGIIDGHIIFHYPNVKDGSVLIEKLHKITSNRETRTIEIRTDNESATYFMSEEEFIKMKPQLIQEGKIDRTQLTRRWWITRDPEHWIPHVGIKGWENSLKERFDINEENEKYSEADLAKIQELIEKSIESKRGEER